MYKPEALKKYVESSKGIKLKVSENAFDSKAQSKKKRNFSVQERCEIIKVEYNI